jgi:uncharacterized protein (TIGR03435 family)
MLQSLLEDRFRLALHPETRTEPVYELVVAKGGPKLKESAGPGPDGTQGILGNRIGDVTVTNMPIPSLVGFLSQQLGRSVVDKTGLSGKYDTRSAMRPKRSPAKVPCSDLRRTPRRPPIPANPPSSPPFRSRSVSSSNRLRARLRFLLSTTRKGRLKINSKK